MLLCSSLFLFPPVGIVSCSNMIQDLELNTEIWTMQSSNNWFDIDTRFVSGFQRPYIAIRVLRWSRATRQRYIFIFRATIQYIHQSHETQSPVTYIIQVIIVVKQRQDHDYDIIQNINASSTTDSKRFKKKIKSRCSMLTSYILEQVFNDHCSIVYNET